MQSHRQQRPTRRVLVQHRAALRHHRPDHHARDHRRTGVQPEQQAVADRRQHPRTHGRDREPEVDRPEQQPVRTDPFARLEHVGHRRLHRRPEQVTEQTDQERGHPDHHHRPGRAEQDQRRGGAEEADQHGQPATDPVGQPAAGELRGHGPGTDRGRHGTRRTGGEVTVVGEVEDQERLHEAAEPVDQLAHPQRPEGPGQSSRSGGFDSSGSRHGHNSRGPPGRCRRLGTELIS